MPHASPLLILLTSSYTTYHFFSVPSYDSYGVQAQGALCPKCLECRPTPGPPKTLESLPRIGSSRGPRVSEEREMMGTFHIPHSAHRKDREQQHTVHCTSQPSALHPAPHSHLPCTLHLTATCTHPAPHSHLPCTLHLTATCPAPCISQPPALHPAPHSHLP